MATYPADAEAKLSEVKDFPQMEPGAPSPVVLGDEYNGICVAYLIRSELDSIGPEEFAIVRFKGVTATYWGSPNEEALHGHPLSKNGLRSYATWEVKNSPWIKRLEEMNRVHSKHRPERFADYRHFIITFHDSTFECVARGFDVSQLAGSMSSVILEMQRLVLR